MTGPQVTLTVEIDLTGPGDWREKLREQTRHIPPGSVVDVRVPAGWDPEMGQAIAGHLAAVADRINLRQAGGAPGGPWLLASTIAATRDHAAPAPHTG
ncbi:hypothetical protein FH609_011610 [Streptomyces sp. 3MP-14]|uniref:Uncharacterized protein n=1 Tax=Streptomyces mimosae TaxID=2586635 RepID=A0A5N6AG55_9ACTN|nr:MULTISPECIES: hypothetical protein [Streptomyces]KAB8167043.1 hypothetical protein FH607_009060 [Streptomyces mimosae]KAB8176984.1 hypothetical protein FH609_011610 [Streptomyces sp. 3MP-14]